MLLNIQIERKKTDEAFHGPIFFNAQTGIKQSAGTDTVLPSGDPEASFRFRKTC